LKKRHPERVGAVEAEFFNGLLSVVVASAIGAVGSVVGQLARLKGARAIGIAGALMGRHRLREALNALGFALR